MTDQHRQFATNILLHKEKYTMVSATMQTLCKNKHVQSGVQKSSLAKTTSSSLY